MYVRDLGIVITAGEGVTDITDALIASGYEMPKPGTSAAKSEPEGKKPTATDMPSEEVVITEEDVKGEDVFKTNGVARPWYKSPWLWGGAAVLVVAGTTAAIYFRRQRAY